MVSTNPDIEILERPEQIIRISITESFPVCVGPEYAVQGGDTSGVIVVFDLPHQRECNAQIGVQIPVSAREKKTAASVQA